MKDNISVLRLEWFWETGSDANSGRIDGLRGAIVADYASDVISVVPWFIRERRTITDAMVNGAWIKDIKGWISIRTFHQVLTLWEIVTNIHLDPSVEEKWTWHGKRKEITQQDQCIMLIFVLRLNAALPVVFGRLGRRWKLNSSCGSSSEGVYGQTTVLPNVVCLIRMLVATAITLKKPFIIYS